MGQESGLRLVVITLYLNPDQYLFFSSELLNSLPYFAHVQKIQLFIIHLFYYKTFLQARLELATSALLVGANVFDLLSYKYHALTNCATGDVMYICGH